MKRVIAPLGLWLLATVISGLIAMGVQAEPKKLPFPWKATLPPAGAVRVQVPLTEQGTGRLYFSAQLPLPGGSLQFKNRPKPADARAEIDQRTTIKVTYDALLGSRSVVSKKKWQQWGFPLPPAGQLATIPELWIPAVQLAPNPKQHRDVQIRLTNLNVELVESPEETCTIFGSDLLLLASDLTRHNEARWQPHLHFSRNYLELTVPQNQIRRLETAEILPREKASGEEIGDEIPVAAVVASRGSPILTYVAINGKDEYLLPSGQRMKVRAMVASALSCGIAMTMGTARGCGVEITDREVPGQGLTFKTTMAKGRIRELRLELFPLPEGSRPRDLVLENLEVWIDLNDSDHWVWLGPDFWRQHFTEPIYVCTPQGSWKVYAFLSPRQLVDPKTRLPRKPN